MILIPPARVSLVLLSMILWHSTLYSQQCKATSYEIEYLISDPRYLPLADSILDRSLEVPGEDIDLILLKAKTHLLRDE